ncbi:heterokaryon incompatibility protein-domain-containing protein [Xylariaceae sp. AK1471]|nr:heterokaryon incompatibility protein-domain-containing protein [Xylariaceae sp. AK1471]
MADDLGDSLATIRQHHEKPLTTLLLDIQETEIQHLKSAEFMQKLECLYFSQPTTLKRKRINAFNRSKRNYVALSYTWGHPIPLIQPCGKYLVQSRSGAFLPSEVRDSVFERVEKYMNHFGLYYLWIDRHCIVQEESKEKNTAVQAMDLVYSCSKHPIGLLYQPIITLAELKLLAGLMTWWKLIDKPRFGFTFSSPPLRQDKRKTLKLLEAMVSDMWWTRAWTYQENYRAGTNMKLLIPHCISCEGSLENYSNEYIEIWKDLPGEIVLSSTKFHKAATAFCLAFEHPPDDLLKVRELVLERAGNYTLLLKEPGRLGHDLARRSMSPSIVTAIEKRQLSVPFDRLPIIANCCQYSLRLDSTELMKRGHSLSLAILALFLLNGEILRNELNHRAGVSNTLNITGFLDKQAFCQYSPPKSAYGLTYNKSCRFIDVELTNDGIKTQGHLWKLGCCMDTSEFPQRRPYVENNGYLKLDDQRWLGLLANEIDKRVKSDLSKDILKYLEQGKLIRLAVLVDPSGGYSRYRGIFICNDSRPQCLPKYVFTASREMAAGNDKDLTNDTDRHVSIEVDCEDETRRPPFLHTRGWIHGLCFFYRCPRIEAIFPWPSTLET